MKNLLITLLILVYCSPAFAWQNLTQSEPYKYGFASSVTVNTIKTGSGILHTLTVQGGTTSTIDIYDSRSAGGNVISSFTTTNALATYYFDVGFASGCTVVTPSGALKYTVSYQ